MENLVDLIIITWNFQVSLKQSTLFMIYSRSGKWETYRLNPALYHADAYMGAGFQKRRHKASYTRNRARLHNRTTTTGNTTVQEVYSHTIFPWGYSLLVWRCSWARHLSSTIYCSQLHMHPGMHNALAHSSELCPIPIMQSHSSQQVPYGRRTPFLTLSDPQHVHITKCKL